LGSIIHPWYDDVTFFFKEPNMACKSKGMPAPKKAQPPKKEEKKK
jgi:hypothetical protein